MKKNKKILIIRLGAIGDVVHTTVIAQAIKNKYPNSEIHYLTQSIIKPLVELSPNIDKVFDFDMSKKDNIFYLLKFCLQFFKQRYNIIYNLTNSTRDILISYLSMPNKIVKRKSSSEHAVKSFFYTAQDGISDLELPENLDLQISDNLKIEINKKIKSYSRPYFVFNPGGEGDNGRQGRIWSAQNWIELGNRLIEKYGGTIFICGSKAEKEAHKIYKDIKNCVIFSGELSLTQSAALYKQSDVMISGDSGPLHIADAVGANVIALMGSTSPNFCGPYGKNNKYIEPSKDCRYCGQKKCIKLLEGEKYTPCMQSITVKSVEKMIETYINCPK